MTAERVQRFFIALMGVIFPLLMGVCAVYAFIQLLPAVFFVVQAVMNGETVSLRWHVTPFMATLSAAP